MKATLRKIKRYFDVKCAAADDVWARRSAGTLTSSPEHLHLVLGALSYATFNQYQPRIDGKSVILETRIKNIDDFMVQLNVVNAAMEKGGAQDDWDRLQESVKLVSLYDFLVSNEGFVIPLYSAVKRSTIPVVRYLTAIDGWMVHDEQQYQYQLDKTELMRYHLLEVMLAMMAESDQVKSMQQ